MVEWDSCQEPDEWDVCAHVCKHTHRQGQKQHKQKDTLIHNLSVKREHLGHSIKALAQSKKTLLIKIGSVQFCSNRINHQWKLSLSFDWRCSVTLVIVTASLCQVWVPVHIATDTHTHSHRRNKFWYFFSLLCKIWMFALTIASNWALILCCWSIALSRSEAALTTSTLLTGCDVVVVVRADVVFLCLCPTCGLCLSVARYVCMSCAYASMFSKQSVGVCLSRSLHVVVRLCIYTIRQSLSCVSPRCTAQSSAACMLRLQYSTSTAKRLISCPVWCSKLEVGLAWV